VSKYWRTRKKN